ncbi:TPT domain-containing protein [Mycena indigotica]|uniref:GDP-mannose transporter n=1 Tax=Mycena indigotica TaxID=2126181 RepID=A0A8H6S934_9AGAR|nr:TPT domain-containing protein [Mycena indigotica]KAF7295093.1 TPT domain-containing protein [Mycena indigotica]
MQSQPESSPAEVAAVVVFYIVAALIMVFVNKAVLNHTPDLPFTFLWVQTSVAVGLLRILAFLNTTRLASHMPQFKLPMFNIVTFQALLPYLIMGVSGLIFNTLCLAGVDAAFFQIARGLLLPFTIGLSALQLHARPSSQILLAAGIVSVGFLIGSTPTFYYNVTSSLTSGGRISHESAMGLVYGIISSFILSVHAVLKKSALGHVDQSVITLSYCGNLFMTTLLVPCIILHGELSVIHKKFDTESTTYWTPFIIGSLVTGVFGFLLGISHSLSIKVTSPITHMFSSAAKGVIQTLLGIWIFGDIMTLSRVFSITIITSGTVYFTFLQTRAKPKHRLPKANVKQDIESQALLDPSDLSEEKKQIFEGKPGPGWVVRSEHEEHVELDVLRQKSEKAENGPVALNGFALGNIKS